MQASDVEIATAHPDWGAITATTKPGCTGTQVARRIADRYAKSLGFQTVVGAALAEARWGAAHGIATHAYITLGTGVGVGLVSGGQPVQGVTHG